MESLMKSLLGKEEAFVIERLQAMMRNEEIVAEQKEEINILKSDLENLKEDNYNLKNKLEYKSDVIEDMEIELEKLEKIASNEKKKFESKEKDLYKLEMLISEQVEEINILRDNNLSMVNQISENLRMEKDIHMQTEVIKDLKDAEKVKVDKLLHEVENLQKVNEEKVKLLQNIQQEKRILEDELKTEQEEKYALLEDKEKVVDGPSLEEELDLASQIPHKISCESCGKGFVTRCKLKTHYKLEHGRQHRIDVLNESLVSLETNVLQQKFIFATRLLKLIEQESKRKYACQCKGVCKINHRIYNWSKPRSETISSKSKDIFEKRAELEPNLSPCNNCDKIFKNSEELKIHSDTSHCIENCLINPWGLNFLH